MAAIRTRVTRDANEVVVLVSASNHPAISEAETFLTTKGLRDQPAALKLVDVVYSLEEGMTLFLWWDDEKGDTLILPLEGRGRLDLAQFDGIHNPRNAGWTGHVQRTTVPKTPGWKSFFLGLELS